MHPKTAGILNNLATFYKTQGKYGEAESLLKRALTICEHILGREHPSTRTVRENYATLLQTMGRNTEAKWLEEAP
jgi:Flp pilus assembly protein TadD